MLIRDTLAIVALSGYATASMVGLALKANSPATWNLVSVNETSGVLADLGPPHTELASTGDLCAIDSSLGVFYYLGDTSSGTTLVGLSVADGSEVCSSVVSSLEEIGIVGAGQSLDFDPSSNSLILSGVYQENGTQHAVLRLLLDTSATTRALAMSSKDRIQMLGGCGVDDTFKTVSFFGDDAYLPFVHASALDVTGQRLFVTLQPGDDEVSTNTLSIGVVDVSSDQSGAPYYRIDMDM